MTSRADAGRRLGTRVGARVGARVGIALAAVLGVLATLLSAPAVAGVATAPAARVPSDSGPLPVHSAVGQPEASHQGLAGRAWHRGKCRSGRGVTVVVDFRSLEGGTKVRCVKRRVGRSFTGLDALQTVDIRVRGVRGYGKSFACRLQGRPGPRRDVNPGPGVYREKCRRIPPKSAYWSYWYARDGGRWRYSKTGLTARHVIKGGFEGWSYHAGRGDAKPPRKRPNRPGRAMPPASTDRTRTPSVSAVVPASVDATSAAVVRSAGLAVPTRLATSLDTTTDASTRAAHRAATWLSAELESGRLPGPSGRTDWGLTIDALLALRAAGVADAAAEQMVQALADGIDGYLGPDVYHDPGARIAGATAKTLVAAVTSGDGSVRMGGYDLRSELLALMQGAGDHRPGRFSDRRTGFDSSNTVTQSLAVIGLVLSGGVPRPALTYLHQQQCPAGWFRMYGDRGRTCADGPRAASTPDVDGTAMALQALLASRAAGADGLQGSISSAVAWLVGEQAPDGSFAGGELTTSANANSTGLAAQALAAAGRPGAAARASSWLRSLQIDGSTTGRAAGDIGAVAYDEGALRGARSLGIDPLSRDQWRRATAQAVLGLAGTSFVEIGDAGSEDRGAAAGASPSSASSGWTDSPQLLVGSLTGLLVLGAAAAVGWRLRRRAGLPA